MRPDCSVSALNGYETSLARMERKAGDRAKSRRQPNFRARRASAANTDTTLTRAPNGRHPMAVSKRNTASSLTQEPPLTIARVALYARISTLNGQDPEMQ